MKNHNAVKEALNKDHAIRAVPEVVIDWNMNRYVGAVADNTPSDSVAGFDVEIFPIESIVANNRPTKGINKARVGQATIGEDYRLNASGVSNGRFYIADVDDTYKYWTSPGQSDAAGNISNVKPHIIYNTDVEVNKITITMENTWASAKNYSVQVTTSPTPGDTMGPNGWVEIRNQTSGNYWRGSGQITLYWTGHGWGGISRSYNEDGSPRTTTIRGIRLVVTSLEGGFKATTDYQALPTTYSVPNSSGSFTTYNTTGANSAFNLIEMAAHLEADLSPYVISVSDNFDMAEVSNLYPIGTVTANQAAMELSNLYQNAQGEWVPGLFSRNNAESPFHNFIEANAEVTAKLRFYDEDAEDYELGTVQQFKMYTDIWTGQGNETVAVELTDYSKFFDAAESKLRAAMWENLTVPEIVWRILDSVGFVNYQIDHDADRVTEHRIPIFYTDGEKTVWEVLADLSKAAQCAIYFDSYGVLQVKTRDFAFSEHDTPVWNFTSVSTSEQLANIVDMEVNTAFEPNHYKVTFQKTNWSPENSGQPVMQQVWTPEDTLALRATALTRTLDVDNPYIWISAEDARYWPYAGMVNIEGELIKYDGKYFVYYTGGNGNIENSAILRSDDDYHNIMARTPAKFQHKNHLLGPLRIIERGVWNSENKRHAVEAEGYSVHRWVDGQYKADVPGFRHMKAYSRVDLHTGPSYKKGPDMLVVTRGQSDDNAFFNYGTRLRLINENGRSHQRAGIVIHNAGTKEDGYFFEITPTKMIKGKTAEVRKELWVYSRDNGTQTTLGTAPLPIVENLDYEMDISFAISGSDHILNCWINGKRAFGATVSGAPRVNPNGKFGMFVRGQTRADFEYLYAIRREEESPLLEDFSFLDKVATGYMGGQWDREWVYRSKSYRRRVKKKWVPASMKFNRQFFDEFGPIVHEVREFDVKFEPAPVLHSSLYMTNDWAAIPLEYRADPYGARFVIANTDRRTAILNGDDSLSFSGTGNSVNQVTTVLGRALVIGDDEEVVSENLEQIRRRGKNTSEISSPWIQSKAMATDLANWMNAHFSYGNESLTAEVFGNPLIEIGDVVSVNYPEKHISGDFFVTGIQNEFNNGLSTTLELRRRAS